MSDTTESEKKNTKLFKDLLDHKHDISPGLVACLCGSMASDIPRDGIMPAGLTYIGQMISHEIVPSSSGVKTYLKTINQITPFLDLDSLYGDDQFRNENTNNRGKFKLGSSVTTEQDGTTKTVYGQDLLRKGAEVKIPEQRNDENVLVSQLHLFWLRFHNKIVDTYFSTLSGTEAFNKARAIVVKAFHKVVVDDFLYHVLDPEIYKRYCHTDKTYIYTKKKENNAGEGKGKDAKIDKNNNRGDDEKEYEHVYDAVPYEFSHAVFRFGHSMVRRKYQLQKDASSIKLQDLFNREHGERIPSNKVVDWRLMFGLDNDSALFQSASRIDLRFATAMGEAPAPDNSKNMLHLIGANLTAGRARYVPTGGQVVDCLRGIADSNTHPTLDSSKEALVINKAKMPAHPEFDIPVEYMHPKLTGTLLEPLQKEINVKDLPLWLYALIENNSLNQRGTRLGKVGSTIVAEVIMSSIKGSQFYEERPVHAGDCNYSNFLFERTRLKMIDLIDFVEELNYKRGLI
jgi:hypothetical protein